MALLALCALVMMGTAAQAADPGLTYPWASEVSDQKAGSVLVYPYYTSTPAAANNQNTRFNITNTSTTSAAFVHLFFVDGGSCSVSDRYICLTANQTLTFLASEQDPGTTGYLVAISVDGVVGCPNSFNFLIGDAYVKTESGHQANLGAEAFAALYEGSLPGCDGNSTAANVAFDGVLYNRWPLVLAVSSIPPLPDGNDTRLIIIRGGGSLISGVTSAGSLFGILYNDQEEPHSWTVSLGCQRVTRLDDNFPRTTPRFQQVIPAGQSGWTKFWSPAGVSLLGAVINQNANAATASGAFRGGRNLHKLTLAPTTIYTIPIFPPACGGIS
jgi:hypothetical protein